MPLEILRSGYISHFSSGNCAHLLRIFNDNQLLIITQFLSACLNVDQLLIYSDTSDDSLPCMHGTTVSLLPYNLNVSTPFSFAVFVSKQSHPIYWHPMSVSLLNHMSVLPLAGDIDRVRLQGQQAPHWT